MPYQLRSLDTIAEKTERTYIKIAIGAILGLILFILAGWGGWRAYVVWQEKRLVRAGEAQIQKGDLRNASLAARAALQLNPSSPGAARIVAQIAERTNDRKAIEWRRKVVEGEGYSAPDILAWARAALQFKNTPEAGRALARLSAQDKTSAGYHAVAAVLAQTRNRPAEADHELAEAARLEPGNKIYQFQLAQARLNSSKDELRQSAIASLTNLRNDPEQRLAATRTLISDGVARQARADKLLELANELQAYPEATLADRLLYLSFLRQTGDQKFTAYLSDLEQQVTSNPPDLALLLGWLSRSNLNLLALDYLRTLPPETLDRWPLPLAIADIHLRLKDWRRLEEFTKDANWHTYDFLRHAYLARALRERDRAAAGEHEWAAAVKGAGEPQQMLTLADTIFEWGWNREVIDLYWELAKTPDKQLEALSSLYKHYSKIKDTQGLYRALLRLHEMDAENTDLENNLAQISLLLNATPEDARRMAAEVYAKDPKNPAYATTYAYALLSKGDKKHALEVMNSLTEQQLRDPAVSAYYGICLAAVGDARADKYLDAAQSSALLPEEQRLVEKARADLAAQSSGH